VDGDGCFHISICTSKSSKGGYICRLHFTVSQHSRDLPLLNSFMNYLGCGRLCKSSTRAAAVEFVVTKLSDLDSKIIPFFKKYPLPPPAVLQGGMVKKDSTLRISVKLQR
jgi:hypothetical protein